MNRKFRIWMTLAGLALLLTLSACGQKGNLYLPDKKPQTATSSTG